MTRVAVIDIGTLKTKFVAAEFDSSGERTILAKDKKLTVIGRDLEKNHNHISDTSLQTQITALEDFLLVIRQLGIDRFRVIGTEAMRRASNNTQVLDAITSTTGVPTEILSHEEEARIFFRAIASDITGDLAVADIGGGSVQLTIGSSAGISETHLLKTGTYMLQERFRTDNHPTPAQQAAAWDYVRSHVASLGLRPQPHLIFVCGSTNIIDFFRETGIPMTGRNDSRYHPYKSQLDSLRSLYDKLQDHPFEKRMELFPSEPYFMWGADKTIMNVRSLCEALGIEEVVPSNMNLSDGLLRELSTASKRENHVE